MCESWFIAPKNWFQISTSDAPNTIRMAELYWTLWCRAYVQQLWRHIQTCGLQHAMCLWKYSHLLWNPDGLWSLSVSYFANLTLECFVVLKSNFCRVNATVGLILLRFAAIVLPDSVQRWYLMIIPLSNTTSSSLCANHFLRQCCT